MSDKAGQAVQMAKDNPLAAGALAAVLLGTGAGRQLTGTAVRLGGLAAIGGLAYKAYQNYKAGQQPAASANPADAGPELLPPPADTPFHPATAPQGEGEFALTLVRAMVAAAKAECIGAIGVDLTEWTPTAPVIEPMTFLFVGRLLREKGILEFIEAARAVHAAHPEARFVVLGAPDTNPSSISAQQMQTWVDEGLVAWPGHVEVKPWLAEASVFVLPSYREGVPRSTQEAMAMGKANMIDVVTAVSETEVAVDAVVAVRDRVIQAYEDIMKMPI